MGIFNIPDKKEVKVESNLDDQVTNLKRWKEIKDDEALVKKHQELDDKDEDKVFDPLEQFLKELPSDQPRFGLVDVEYFTEDNRQQNKLCFVMWAPDNECSVKDKMLYS